VTTPSLQASPANLPEITTFGRLLAPRTTRRAPRLNSNFLEGRQRVIGSLHGLEIATDAIGYAGRYAANHGPFTAAARTSSRLPPYNAARELRLPHQLPYL